MIKQKDYLNNNENIENRDSLSCTVEKYFKN